MAAAPPLRDRLSFLHRLPILLKGTSDDDIPCPGYLFEEIAKISHESVGSSQCLLEYLLNRLDTGSGHVKLKVLKILLYLCGHGSSSFLLILKRNSALIQEATAFAGPPDPLHGNSLYQKVRAAAQDLGSTLFSDAMPLPPSQPPQALPPAGMGAQARPHSALQGFGYSKEWGQTGSAGKTFLSTIQRAAEVMANAVRAGPENPSTQGPLPHGDTYQPAVTPSTSHTHPNPGNLILGARAVRHQPGQAGGGWDELDSGPSSQNSSCTSNLSRASDSGSRSGSSGSDSHSGTSREPGDLTERAEAMAPNDCQQELSLVRTVTQGPRVFLSREETQHFIKECGLLNCEAVLELLLRQLVGTSECEQMRTLCAIASFGSADLLPQEHVLLLCRQQLQELGAGNPGPVTNKATKILRHFEASCGQRLPALRPCAQPNSAAVLVGTGDLLTSPVPPPGSQAFLQPLSSTTVMPRNPGSPPSSDTCPSAALEDVSQVKTQLVSSSEQGTGFGQSPEKTDTPEDSSSSCLWNPNSLFEGMELVACPRLPCPSSRDLQPGLQKEAVDCAEEAQKCQTIGEYIPLLHPEVMDLSLVGLPPPMSQRPSSASATKSIVRSMSVATGSEPRKKALEATGPGGSRAINNLRRSNSTTQVNQSWAGSLRSAEPSDFLMLFEGDASGRKRVASLSKASSGKEASWNVLDDQPKGFALPASVQSPSTLDSALGPRRKECALAPSFTVNNRSNKGAVGNCVTTMVHNHYASLKKASPPKSSNQTAPSLNNIMKAAAREGSEGSDLGKPRKNFPGGNHSARGTTGLLRRKEVTEEEAERFIHQVNQAAVTIQRWYRRQVQRRQAGAASLERLLASKREGQRQRLGSGNLLDLHRQEEAARKKAREEKARRARQAAIQELQQKRAQKAGETEHRLPKDRPETRAVGQPRPIQEPPLMPTVTTQQTKANNASASIYPAGPGDPCPPATVSSPELPQPPEDKPQDIQSQDVAREDLEVLGRSRSKVRARATLDELLDTLRLLEEEPEPLPRPKTYHKDRYAWTDEEDDTNSLTADNLERFGKLSAPQGPPDDGTLLSEAKLQSIMSFLDEMEKSGQDRPAPQRESLVLETGPRPLELGPEGSTSMMRLKLEVEEKKQAMVLLQRALAQQRDLTIRRVKETEKELNRQLRQQKEHYEATIQRHLSFIDQLIEDKKILSDKCEAVVAELKQGDQRCRERMAQMQEQHELEIKKLKELMSATEKIRREKWINEKTKKIKEITVRGLEPEIQKLIAKHKQEVRRLRGLHEAELQQRDEQAAQRHLRQAEELREHLEREKEALSKQEHERAQQRFEQHLEQEQRALEQQRRRLYNEVAEEKERLGQQASRQRAELDELRQQLGESSAALTRTLRAEFERSREDQEQRHQMELKALKDQLEAERQAWVASCAKKEEAWLLTRERELKEEIRKGRDQEIELVIHRLEADMTLAKEESERAAESRVKRVRDKYELELSELEQSERKLQERCTELKGRLGEAEGERERLQSLVRQKEKELEDVRLVNTQMCSERASLAQVIRQEFADQLAASQEENQRVKAELAELRARQQMELDEVHRRVKTALARKEEAVNSLRKQHEAAVKRADHLEELLEQHRQPSLNAK
ncbi:centrosomal protein of 131 kDa isoform X1 [Sigmodon hispidus]